MHRAHVLLNDPTASGDRVLKGADVTVDLGAFRVRRRGVVVHLGPIEYRLLCHFLRHQHEVQSRDALIRAAWPSGAQLRPATVDMHILRLRRALAVGDAGDVIHTIRAAGYLFGNSPPEHTGSLPSLRVGRQRART